ncbi:MAG: HlyC/CorC family transporter [Deltaproteobacteria bacterium]|nr:HlyC/CorC family transporter [Deltaproteobacteria bacterium]
MTHPPVPQPGDWPPVWLLAGAALCLVGATLGAVAQLSVRALGRERQQQLFESGQAGRGLRAWLENPLRMLLSSVLARIALPGLATWLTAEAVDNWDPAADLGWRAGLAVPLLHVLVAEVLLATLAKHRAARVAELAVAAFRPVDLVLWPLSAPLALLARRVALLVSGGDRQAMETGPFLLEEDMARLWGLAPDPRGHPAEPQEKRLLRGVLEFRDAVVREVMVPRTRMLVVDADITADEVLRRFAQHAHTRMPVTEAGSERVVGVLFLSDLIRAQTSGQPAVVRQLLRRPYFVPELMKVGDLLREFQKRRTHLAVVVDEFGTTSGLVTLQDVIEELVGDVRDEEDVQDPSVRQVTPGSWLLDGRVSVDAAAQALGVSFPADGAYETVGGFLITRLGRLPPTGTQLRWNGLVFSVKEADDRRITKVLIEREVTPAAEPPAAAEG